MCRLLNCIHLAISTKQQSHSTPYDSCAVSSWLIIYLLCVTFFLLVASNIIRSANAFSLPVEIGLAIVFVSVAIVLAAASGAPRPRSRACPRCA